MDNSTRVEFVVHSSMFSRGEYCHLGRIYDDLEQVARLDLRYHYSGSICARRWLDLCSHRDYGHLELVRVTEKIFPRAINEIERKYGQQDGFSVFSLGPGDAEVDSRLLHIIEDRCDLESYTCVDTSIELLRLAVNKVLNTRFRNRRFKINAICGDFTKIRGFGESVGSSAGVNLFALTGFTLGNYVESELLDGISRGMKSNDFLFLDARLHHLAVGNAIREIPKQVTDSLITNYSNDLVNRFVFGPVEVCTNAKAEDVAFAYEVNRSVTCVPGALNIVIHCRNLHTTMRFTREHVKRSRMDLAATTLYSYPELVAWLSNLDFEVVWHSETESIGFFLLRKR